MTDEVEWWIYDDSEEMAEAVAGDVGFILDSALDARGDALLIAPGGATSAAALTLLTRQKRDWKRVTIVPSDDRLVAVDDDRANVKHLARLFLPLGARVMPLTGTVLDDPAKAGRAAAARLADLKWPPDLAWLDVGADGHVASIFTGEDYDEALNAPRDRRAVGVRPANPPADAPMPRVTLTRPALLSARAIILSLTGEAKRALVEQAIADGEGSPHPVGRLLAAAEQPIDIHWVL